MSFRTVLVANRGEIAVRVMRTAHQLGYRTVAVYSEADAEALHVSVADEAVCIGPAVVSASYLNVDAVLDAARRTGAEAIHPGYGFLSENAGFARAVQAAGLVWIGPPAEAIEAMGDKARSKARMLDANVPCVPGFMGDSPDDDALIAAANDVGFPLLVKASAGGGGRGMRRVHGPDDLSAAIRSARAEAANAFGDDTLLLEHLVEGGRHVEVQVFADQHGNVIHLGERDCSVQRRHQKVIEEAPSPAVDAALRDAMGQAACAAARAVGYVGAGTVEFLLGPDGRFFFLEMNTRLQVEHPVTEAVTGLDLVELQLRVAAGEPLPLTQEQVTLDGHAIELRLYAEDPGQNYLPQPGEVVAWRPPKDIRVDSGLGSQAVISPYYDPMVAKLIAHGPDRGTAIRRLLRALDETVLFGVTSNRDLLARLLVHPTFADGQATTDFLDATPELTEPDAPQPHVLAAAMWFWRGESEGFRTAHVYDQPFTVRVDGERVDGRWTASGVELDGQAFEVSTVRDAVLVIDGVRRTYQVHRAHDRLWVRFRGTEHCIEPFVHGADGEVGSDGRVVMPMAGQVLAIEVAVGDTVAAGDRVAIVEAMKLETPLRAPISGVVEAVNAAPGAALSTGDLVVQIIPQEES